MKITKLNDDTFYLNYNDIEVTSMAYVDMKTLQPANDYYLNFKKTTSRLLKIDNMFNNKSDLLDMYNIIQERKHKINIITRTYNSFNCVVILENIFKSEYKIKIQNIVDGIIDYEKDVIFSNYDSIAQSVYMENVSKKYPKLLKLLPKDYEKEFAEQF